jgi:hypothetical protein
MDSVMKIGQKMTHLFPRWDQFNDDDRENVFDAYETDGMPSSIQAAPRWDERTQENLPCSSVRQGVGGSGVTPKCQDSDSQARYLKQHEAQAWWGLCEDMYVEWQAWLEQQAGQDQPMKDGIAVDGSTRSW